MRKRLSNCSTAVLVKSQRHSDSLDMHKKISTSKFFYGENCSKAVTWKIKIETGGRCQFVKYAILFLTETPIIHVQEVLDSNPEQGPLP